MLINPDKCPHDSTFRRGDGKILCLKCMAIPADLKKKSDDSVIRINATEDVHTQDVGHG